MHLSCYDCTHIILVGNGQLVHSLQDLVKGVYFYKLFHTMLLIVNYDLEYISHNDIFHVHKWILLVAQNEGLELFLLLILGLIYNTSRALLKKHLHAYTTGFKITQLSVNPEHPKHSQNLYPMSHTDHCFVLEKFAWGAIVLNWSVSLL